MTMLGLAIFILFVMGVFAFTCWKFNVPYLIPLTTFFFLINLGVLFFIKKIVYYKTPSEDQLHHMAYHDPLTGLFNRNGMEQYLNELFQNHKKTANGFAMIILDLDYFKNINDSLGHEVGDTLLKIIAERLRNTVRVDDMVSRIGGDEFVIIVSETKNVETVAHIAQKILNTILKVIPIKGRELYITTSIGISIHPYDGEKIEKLINNADMALYRAKESGRNNYQFCTPDLTQKAQQKTERQNAMSHGLLKEEFLLYYLPSMNLTTQSIVSVEALLRWQSKEYGLVTPDSIISIAEESGLIVPLSEWIVRTACKQVKLWKNNGHSELTLSINVSPRQFKDTNFVDNILRAIRETDFPKEALILEIKEGLIMNDPANATSVLTTLKQAGMKIVIDDFGTGFSSFSYLSNDAVDKIKIDKSFIDDIARSPNDAAIVSAMILMAKKLGITAVAEGVETKEQYDILKAEGCDEIQGYYLAKPLPSELMESFLSSAVVKLPVRK